jgi:hypothetical protein
VQAEGRVQIARQQLNRQRAGAQLGLQARQALGA